MIDPALVSSAIITGVVGALMGLMRRMMANRTSTNSQFPPLDVLEKKYKKLNVLTFLGFIFLLVIFTGIFYFIFSRLYQLLYHSTAEAAVWFLPPAWVAWVLLGMFFGMIAAGSAVIIISYVFLKKEQWDEFNYYSNSMLPKPFTTISIFFWMSGAIFLVTLVCTFFIFGHYTSLTNTTFSFRPLFGVSSHSYDYSQVEELKLKTRPRTPSDGPLKNCNAVEVKFTDGTIWDSDKMLLELSDDQFVDMLKFVSQKSGKDIQVYTWSKR
ncbi:MAG: hypothetical protein ABI254_08275 [Chthoniobacterales bacterium]